ncbi:YfgM family protein [Thiogranum longum]|jgi:predicted negative regulator of RcsB-dependent stress response
MDVHASEKEQIDALKKWWKENGSSVITGLLLGLSVLLGGKAWFGYQETQTLNASNVYAQMMAELSRNDADKVRTHANQLISNYSSSGYAPLAALALASLAAQEGELGAAQAQLEWALEKADSETIKHTARIRLVRVMIDRAQYAPAAQLLESVVDGGAYQYLYTELKGDLAMAQERPEQAATAYQEALEQMPANSPNAGFLRAKFENVSAAGENTP